jgi:sporulation protein YlmC with PRC-barrel domain
MIVATAVLNGHRVVSADGDVGTVDDILFESDTWNVRYLVVGASSRARPSNVLISPGSIVDNDWTKQEVTVDPAIGKIDVSTSKSPVSAARRGDEDAGAGLHSAADVLGYEVGALDGQVGKIDDVMVDLAHWRIPWFVVATRRGLFARKVPLPAVEVDRISGAERRVYVGLPGKTIRKTSHVVV